MKIIYNDWWRHPEVDSTITEVSEKKEAHNAMINKFSMEIMKISNSDWTRHHNVDFTITEVWEKRKKLTMQRWTDYDGYNEKYQQRMMMSSSSRYHSNWSLRKK